MIEIKKEGPGSYYFNLKTQDGIHLLRSVDFASQEELEGIVGQLPSLMEDHIVFERKTDHNGRFLFLLKDASGKPLGSSQLYHSEAGMENGIKNLRTRVATIHKNKDS